MSENSSQNIDNQSLTQSSSDFFQCDKLSNLIDNDNIEKNNRNSSKSPNSKNHSILKAINKRKLQLACPICSSSVVNMSDHLVKKHSIKDRNERKYLMDLVRKKYLSMG